MGMIIDLAARFGTLEPDITKARKKGPDTGMDYRAWNKANPGHNPKDSRGRWSAAAANLQSFDRFTDPGKANPAAWLAARTTAHGQARRNNADYRNLGTAESEIGQFVSRWTGASSQSDVRKEIARGEWAEVVHAAASGVEAPTLHRGFSLKAKGLSKGHAGFTGDPEQFIARLAPGEEIDLGGVASFSESREQAEHFGDVVFTLEGGRGLPVSAISNTPFEHEWLVGGKVRVVDVKRKGRKYEVRVEPTTQGAPSMPDAPKRDDTFSPGPSPFSPSQQGQQLKANRARLARQLDEATAELDGWDADELPPARDAAKRFAAAADVELKKRKTSSAKPKRATAQVSGKPEPDYEHMVGAMRGLPVVPESADVVRRVLEPLTIPQLKALAQKADVPVSSKMRKQELRDALHKQMIGGRLDTDSVMNYGDPGRYDRRRSEAAGKATPSAAQASAKPMRNQIIDAYDELRGEGEWVDLSRLRPKLGGTREEQDAALMDLFPDPAVAFIPEENQKTLTDARRAAAIRIGGENNHLIGFVNQKRPTRAPEAGPSSTPAAKVTAKPRTRTPRASGTSRPAANEALLSRLSKPRLQEVAARVGVPSTRKTKAQLVESINAATAGAPGTLRRALGDFDVPGDGGNFGGRHGAVGQKPAGGSDAAASLRHAEAQLNDMKADLVSQYGEDPDGWPEARSDRQVEEYYDQLDRVARLRRSAGKA